MKNIYALFTLFGIILFSTPSFSQCADGEVEVEIVVHTDTYGYEAYWQLVPNGNACNSGTIASGGNIAVGCNGAGDQNQTPGGYGDNLEITEGPWCLTENADYDLIYVDDWGDGGFSFDVYVNGYPVATFDGMGLGATFTFTAAEPPTYDMGVTTSNLYQYVSIGSFDIHGHVFNFGTETINTFNFNYAIDGGETQTFAITDANLANYQDMEVEHNTPWVISENGVYEVSIWTDNLNDNADENPVNDTLTLTVEAGPGTPNIIDNYIDAFPVITAIADGSDQVNKPTDLDFHPVLSNKELWVINKDTENSGGSTVTIYNAGESNQTELWKRDGNAWHFMSLPTGIAFSQNGNFANSPGVYDANHNGGGAFTGPALWSSNMDIYAEPSGGNGSHLDMLHQSPYSQGIAAEKDNAFWVFDGYSNDIVRNDFVDDHGPGNDYHADAKIRRYADDQVLRDPNHEVVSHLVLDGESEWLYVVDHGNNRVIRIDINTGIVGGTPPYPANEPYEEYTMVTGYTQETVVASGDLSRPAGIDVIDDRMIVSEFETGEIVIYDISVIPALELYRIETGFSSLQGIKIGPEGKIWGVDYNSNTVFRVDAAVVSAKNIDIAEPIIFPNPTTELLQVINLDQNAQLQLFDMQGKLVKELRTNSQKAEINLNNLESGIYTLKVNYNNGSASKKVVKL